MASAPVLPSRGGGGAPVGGESIEHGIARFNERDFDGCHHLLQRIWVEEDGPVRLLLQGIIQVSAACIHVRRGRRDQALTLVARATPKLAAFLPCSHGIDVVSLVTDTARFGAAVAAAAAPLPDFDEALFPFVRPALEPGEDALATG
jgi:hypothetical protein